jgi:hypothetical protein
VCAFELKLFDLLVMPLYSMAMNVGPFWVPGVLTDSSAA